MRFASRPVFVAAFAGVVVAAISAVALSNTASRGQAPDPAGPVSRYGAPYPPPPLTEPAAPPAPPPPPPPVEAFGSDRSFTFAEDSWLRPGRYIWKPERQTTGPIGIVIDLRRQMGYVYRAGTLIGVTTVSTGRRHYETPTGSFPILQKATWHRSTIYSGAPMNYMQRLTWGGVALHAGGVPGYRQSHGCIHLPPAFARALFKVTSIGAEVRVVRAMPPIGPPMVLAARDPGAGVPMPIDPVHIPSTEQSVAVMTAAAL